MGIRSNFLLALGAVLLVAGPASAAADEKLTIVLKAGRLDAALLGLSAKIEAGLLFSPDVVGDRRSPRVAGTMTLEEILTRLLEGSGLAFRRTGTGAIIIYGTSPNEAVDTLAIPEILVTGRKSQNADIRRTENDIQPYQVFASAEFRSSHADNLGQFLRTRITNNAESQMPAQNPSAEFGTNRSTVNLHGLGSNQTLVLIDGARMPAVPSLDGSLAVYQPDLNGVPLLAIDRVETLTATSGGIYGPGATGGVVNVVLKRDYRGAEVSATYGMTDRGDAIRKRIDARIGFTPDHGRTDVMIAFSHTTSTSLPAGERDYAQKARRLALARDPRGLTELLPRNDGIEVRSGEDGDLSFIPSLGGADLGSPAVYFPIGYRGIQTDNGATLLRSAENIASARAANRSSERYSLTNAANTMSLLLSARHRFGSGIEAFADLVHFQNDGRSFADERGFLSLDGGQGGNPFQQSVSISFPLIGLETGYRNRLGTTRLSTGLIVDLLRDWKAEANYSLGGVETGYRMSSWAIEDVLAPLSRGDPGPDVFGDWATFLAALHAGKEPFEREFERRAQFRDASLRLAGPLATTPAGTIALALLVERRHEAVPESDIVTRDSDGSSSFTRSAFSETVSSLSGEMRAPIVPRSSPIWPLRGLELQLAVRHDDVRAVIPAGGAGVATVPNVARAYTSGLRIFPHDNVMLRGSISTGVLPPSPLQLLQSSATGYIPYGNDPRRGDGFFGSADGFEVVAGGRPELRSETARTWSFGVVLDSGDGGGPRVSVDFTHIDKRNELFLDHQGDVQYFVTHESLYPGRVVRAPLTPADAALGYTGGVLRRVDTSALNVGDTVIDTVDLTVEHEIRLAGGDALRVYGAATWQPRLTRQLVLDTPPVRYTGFANGPLRWRANAGFDWDRGPLMLGMNAQFYDGYLDLNAEDATPATLGQLEIHVPAQFYLDLSAAYRVELPRGSGAKALEFRLGVEDLFDQSPPIVTTSALGYSYYGDPRGRRFEVTIAARF